MEFLSDLVSELKDHSIFNTVIDQVLLGSQPELINFRDRNKNTALIWCIQLDNFIQTQKLIAKGANVNLQNNQLETALVIAVQKKQLEVVKLLIQAGAHIDLQNNKGWTALMFAISEVNIDIVDVLIQAGANINLSSNDSQTPIELALIRHEINIINKLLDAGCNVHIISTYPKYPSLIHLTITLELSEIVPKLIEKGLDVFKSNILTDYRSKEKKVIEWNYLIWALNNKIHVATVNELLKLWPDPNLVDEKGNTFLMVYVQSPAPKFEVVRAFIETDKLNYTVVDKNNNTYLHLTANRFKLFNLFVQYMIPYINSQNKSGRTPLMIAVKEGQASTTKKLLKLGAQTDIQDVEGKTAVMIVSTAKILETILKEIDVDLTIKDNDNFTAPFYWKQNFSLEEVKSLLKNYNIDWNQKGGCGIPLVFSVYTYASVSTSNILTLIELGADPNTVYKNKDIFDFLLDRRENEIAHKLIHSNSVRIDIYNPKRLHNLVYLCSCVSANNYPIPLQNILLQSETLVNNEIFNPLPEIGCYHCDVDNYKTGCVFGQHSFNSTDHRFHSLRHQINQDIQACRNIRKNNPDLHYSDVLKMYYTQSPIKNEKYNPW